MELEPIVGASCASCSDRLLVESDGRNCSRCGLAVHRRCSKTHRAECKGRPALKHESRDYDATLTVSWNARLISTLSVGTALMTFALGVLTNVQTASRGMAITAWFALILGLAVVVGGYFFERTRQQSSVRTDERNA